MDYDIDCLIETFEKHSTEAQKWNSQNPLIETFDLAACLAFMCKEIKKLKEVTNQEESLDEIFKGFRSIDIF